MPLLFLEVILFVLITAFFVTQVFTPILQNKPLFPMLRKDVKVLSQTEEELNQQLENQERILEIEKKAKKLHE